MEIAIVRAAYLNVFISELREVGAPVDRELARSQLPTWIEEMPDAYVSAPLLLAWVARCGSDFEVMELGFRGAQRASLASLNEPLQRALQDAPTGLQRMQTLLRLAVREDSRLMTGMYVEGAQVRVVCETQGFKDNPYLCFAEWLNLQEVISLVRSVAGPDWCPPEMTFISRHPPSASAKEAFPNTRIRVGQPHTSITVGSEILARPCSSVDAPTTTSSNESAMGADEWNLASTLRMLVRPYLGERYPDLARVADIIGMSKRTLQRRLEVSGSTYSDLVQQARFELARELLSDPSAKIIDISMAAGYENSQHFSRAFRRTTGMSPVFYRRTVLAVG